MIQRIVEDTEGKIYPVTDLIDINGHRTDDPDLAVTMVVQLPDGWASSEVATIHTVQ